jgi:hypothetical protein
MRPLQVFVVAGLVLLLGAGVGLAKRVTKPMNIVVKNHIRILEKGADGKYVQVDEVRATSRQFDGSLRELATGGMVESAFTLETKTKKGRPYSAGLARPAKLDFDPTTGRLDAEIPLRVRFDGKSALVLSRSTTESRKGPLGAVRGRRARGLLGKGPMTVHLVAVNEFKAPGEPDRLLVVEEEYRLIPRGNP